MRGGRKERHGRCIIAARMAVVSAKRTELYKDTNVTQYGREACNTNICDFDSTLGANPNVLHPALPKLGRANARGPGCLTKASCNATRLTFARVWTLFAPF